METKEKKEPQTTEKKPVKKTKRKLSKAALALVIGILIIVIPLTIYGGILLSASLQTGSPVEGDRFKGDLDPEITKDDVAKVEDKIKGMTGSQVEDVKVELISGQMRIYIDVEDTLTNEEIEDVAASAYDIVDSILSVDKYFTSKDTRRMYDLSINVFNFIDGENEEMVYYILTKNAMMEEKTIQLVSEPLNEDLAAELRGELTETEDDETVPTEETESQE